MEFNQLLKNARAKANKTLEQVAKDCGVSKATVQRWESGEIKNVRRDKISKLSASLNVSPSYLMGWEDNNVSPLGDYDKNVQYLKDKNQDDLIHLYDDIIENDRLSPSYLMGWEDNNVSPLGDYDKNVQYLKDKNQDDLIHLYDDIIENDRLSILFDKAKQLSPEDLEQVLKIIDTFNKESS